MFHIKKSVFTLSLLLLFTSVSFAHLPSPYDASLKMGRTGNFTIGESSTRIDYTFSNKGEWSPDETYRGDYTIPAGDTVSCGTFNGKKLWWWAKFYAKGENLKPGFFAPQGGTSPWVLINSLSAEETGSSQYKWRGWNGDMDTMSTLSAAIPTWRDGAEGAYSFTHDDIGAMPFDLSVKPAWDVAKDFPEIKQCWGIYVEKMDSDGWAKAREMVLDGHEMFNHSMEHTSAADQWQWFFPGQVVPSHDPSIPEAIRGLTVVGTWGDPAAEPKYPNPPTELTVESELVVITATCYWTQNAPSSETPGTVLSTGVTVMEPVITPKEGVEELTLQTGQKLYVKYTKKDDSPEPTHEGFLAATGPTWFELSQLDQYGGKYWKPALAQPEPWSWDNYTTFTTGAIAEYNGEYWKSLTTPAPGFAPKIVEKENWVGAPEPVQSWEKTDYDPNNPVFSTEGELVGDNWSSSYPTTVIADEGAPGFVAKVWCVEKWAPEEYKVNIADANKKINDNVYAPIITAGEHFRKGKRCEYYGYPFDAYSEVTHDSLETNGFVGARGGAKSGRPIPGDFFHPYRIDFDAFYITRSDWDVTKSGGDYVYPNNPHVLLGANEMVDEIISSKGYMIREFHSVADIADGAWYDNSVPSEQWPINSAAKGVGGWWGGITSDQLRDHYEYVQGKIDERKITVYTVGEVTKYRLTANACSGASITPSGDNYLLSVTTAEDITEKYKDEISVIVSLDISVDSLGVNYKTVNAEWGKSPRRRPRKMDSAGKVWSVSINPFLGDAEIVPNGEWDGQGDELGGVAINDNKIANSSIAKYLGVKNGQVSLRLPAGNYSAKLYNTQGQSIRNISINSEKGINKIDMEMDKLGKGMFILNVMSKGRRVLPAQKIVIK